MYIPTHPFFRVFILDYYKNCYFWAILCKDLSTTFGSSSTMKLWHWLRSILNRKEKPSSRFNLDIPERPIQIEHRAITGPLHEIAEQEQRSVEEIANAFLSHALEEYEHLDEKLAKWNSLSSREQEVAALACMGYTNQDIADKLFISPNTVKTHIRNIQQKFNVRSKEQLRQALGDWDFRAFDL